MSRKRRAACESRVSHPTVELGMERSHPGTRGGRHEEFLIAGLWCPRYSAGTHFPCQQFARCFWHQLLQAIEELSRVVFQKWRWTEIAVTLGLIFVVFLRKEWPMTFIAVRCPHCQSDQIVKRGKTPGAPSAISARTPFVPRAVFCSTIATAGACLKSSKRSSI
jgi:hypothetical protein